METRKGTDEMIGGYEYIASIPLIIHEAEFNDELINPLRQDGDAFSFI